MSTKAERAAKAFAAFQRKVARMDRPTLEAFVKDVNIREWEARERFNKSRSVRDSEGYAKRRQEASHAKSVLNGLPKAD
jgi:hypothetical protein